MPDIPDFVSPVDGSVIHGRAGMRQHFKQHNVTNVSDFTETWKKQAAERAKLFQPLAGYDRERRRAVIARNYKEFKSYGEFQRSIEKLRR